MSLPNLLSEKDRIELLSLPLPTAILGNVVSHALETDHHVIAEITRVLQALKLCSNLRNEEATAAFMQYLFKIVVLRVTHYIILQSYPEERQRILRRWMRISTDGMIYALFEPELSSRRALSSPDCKNENFLAKFLGGVIAACLLEWAGEKIIENAEDGDDESIELEDKEGPLKD